MKVLKIILGRASTTIFVSGCIFVSLKVRRNTIAKSEVGGVVTNRRKQKNNSMSFGKSLVKKVNTRGPLDRG